METVPAIGDVKIRNYGLLPNGRAGAEPRSEPSFSNDSATIKKGIIYKIVCNKTGKTYYGSTMQTLAKRKSMHKLNNSSTSREIVNLGDWKIEQLEEVMFKVKGELLRRERDYIEKHDGVCVNKNRPIVTEKERKEYQQKNMRKWYVDHREAHIKRVTEYNAAHYEKHKENMRNYYARKKLAAKMVQ